MTTSCASYLVFFRSLFDTQYGGDREVTINCSNQQQATAMSLTPHMLSSVLRLHAKAHQLCFLHSSEKLRIANQILSYGGHFPHLENILNSFRLQMNPD